MRIVMIDRHLLGSEGLPLPEGQAFDVSRARRIFDERRLPDGFPFVVDDDGGVSGCRHLNQYLLDAHEQNAFDLGNMRRVRVYQLARLLRYLRRQQAQRFAEVACQPVEEWLALNGEPKLDLIHVSRQDLVGYRDNRRGTVEPATLDNELACFSSFFRYATASGWVPANPFPSWGGRNTLMSGKRKIRQARFLTTVQTAHFLAAGLRGDGCDPGSRPAAPERDYVYGLVLAATGLRREEGAFLLDSEIPSLSGMPADGVHVFERTGKMGVTRSIYVTAEIARAVDLYRQTERAALVRRHQKVLRRFRREGRLLIVEELIRLRGQPAAVIGGHARSTLALTNKDRARAVQILDNGSIEPLGLFVGRGLPPVMSYWNELFRDASGGKLTPIVWGTFWNGYWGWILVTLALLCAVAILHITRGRWKTRYDVQTDLLLENLRQSARYIADAQHMTGREASVSTWCTSSWGACAGLLSSHAHTR